MKQKNGITLIALIITIIILLILAGVSINMILGNSGIITQSKLMHEQSINAQERETIALENFQNEIENYINNDNNTEQEQNFYEKETQDYVKLIEHFNKSDYEDISCVNISSDIKKIGKGSLILNNSSIIINNNYNYGFEADFTIDFWINMSAENKELGWAPIMVVPTYNGMWIGLNNGKFVVRGYANQNFITSVAPEFGKWVHIAVCRKNEVLYLFYDGVLQKQTECIEKFSNANLCLGSDLAGAYCVNTYIDELRILNGECCWESKFDINENEYSQTDGVLYHFDNLNIIDGNAVLSDNNKFGNKSLYLNNSYLEFKNNNDYGFEADFTIDFWINMTVENKSLEWAPIMIVPTYNGMWIGLNNGKFVVRGYANQNFITSVAPEFGKWVHIAVCRKNEALYLFYNGVLQKQTECIEKFSNANLCLGSDLAGHYCMDTYIDEFRILNGYAQWTENFSVLTREYSY